MGHDVTEARSGMEAIGLCQEHAFDLVILDYRMPVMNGLEVAGRLEGTTRFVLHTSDYDNKDLERRALNAGALGVIAKIRDFASFRTDIEAFLRKGEAGGE